MNFIVSIIADFFNLHLIYEFKVRLFFFSAFVSILHDRQFKRNFILLY